MYDLGLTLVKGKRTMAKQYSTDIVSAIGTRILSVTRTRFLRRDKGLCHVGAGSIVLMVEAKRVFFCLGEDG